MDQGRTGEGGFIQSACRGFLSAGGYVGPDEVYAAIRDKAGYELVKATMSKTNHIIFVYTTPIIWQRRNGKIEGTRSERTSVYEC